MQDGEGGTVVRLEAAQQALRRHFLGWQCRLRQLAVREAEGRPTQGMRPEVFLDDRAAGRLTLLIVQAEPSESTAEFRHIVRRTHDPKERYSSALKLLQATYYQYPEDFSDVMTALFNAASPTAQDLLSAGRCRLRFEQFNQRYELPCGIRALRREEPGYQATFWHNALFNPNVPGDAQVLAFIPDWAEAEAEPPAT